MAKLKLSSLFFLIDDFLSVRILYNNIKDDPYAKANSTLLGRKCVKNVLLFGVSLILSMLTIKWLISSYFQAKILSIILAIVLLIGLVPYAIMSLPSSINLLIKQLKLNKRFIGFFNLALFIAVIVVFVIILLTLS